MGSIKVAGWIDRFVERWLAKGRYVFEYRNSKLGSPSHVVLQVRASCELFEQIPTHAFSERLVGLIAKRAGSEHEFPLFVAVEDNEILGYSFLFIPVTRAWHDSLPSNPGEARETSTWVEPAHRGQGVRQSLLAAQVDYCQERGVRLLAVIEAANVASARSSVRSGANVSQRNVLIKVLGRNVLSLTTNPLRAHLLVGARRTHR